jgi:hypothetical protein
LLRQFALSGLSSTQEAPSDQTDEANFNKPEQIKEILPASGWQYCGKALGKHIMEIHNHNRTIKLHNLVILTQEGSL